jgi:hypothetical protein
MEAVRSSVTLINFYQITRHHPPYGILEIYRPLMLNVIEIGLLLSEIKYKYVCNVSNCALSKMSWTRAASLLRAELRTVKLSYKLRYAFSFPHIWRPLTSSDNNNDATMTATESRFVLVYAARVLINSAFCFFDWPSISISSTKNAAYYIYLVMR